MSKSSAAKVKDAASILTLDTQLKFIVGDVLLASAFVSYASYSIKNSEIIWLTINSLNSLKVTFKCCLLFSQSNF